ncbi:hypothetical protein [Taklimakanibacter deserti]
MAEEVAGAGDTGGGEYLFRRALLDGPALVEDGDTAAEALAA